MNVEKLRLQKIISECNQHIEKLNTAYNKLKSSLPLTVERYQHFDEDLTSYLDQNLKIPLFFHFYSNFL